MIDISSRQGGPKNTDATELVRLALAGSVVAIGVAVSIGWIFDITWLKTVLPGLTTMKINAALGFVFGGTAALLMTVQQSYAKAIAASLVLLMGLIGLLTLIEYAIGSSFGIDQLLVKDIDSTSQPFNGRMSPITSGGFVFLATSLALLSVARAPLVVSVAHALASVSFVIALLALTSYAYGAENLHGLRPYLSVALHTGVGLSMLAITALLTRTDEGWAKPFVARPIATAAFLRIALLSMLIPFVAGLLAVLGMRKGLYQAAFSPALFAVATACALVWLALRSARILAKAQSDWSLPSRAGTKLVPGTGTFFMIA